MTTTTTDRARLVDLALDLGWTVTNFGHSWTSLAKPEVGGLVINWQQDDSLDYLVGNSDKLANTLIENAAEVVQLLTGKRTRDAQGARYFTVAEPESGDLDNHGDWVETDRYHGFVLGSFVPQREVIVLAGLARDARSLAKATGSRSSTRVETVFGVELHVTWKRG